MKLYKVKTPALYDPVLVGTLEELDVYCSKRILHLDKKAYYVEINKDWFRIAKYDVKRIKLI